MVDIIFEIKNDKLLKYNGKDEIVVVPEGIVTIGRGAFKDALLMKTIVLPTTLKSIEDGVIENKVYGYNYQIEKVVIGSLEHWLNIDFGGQGSNFMNNNTKLYIDNNLVSSIVIPGNIKRIKQFAFCGYKSLKKVVIEEGVETIEDGAFSSSGLEEIDLPNSLVNLSKEKGFSFGYQHGAFYDCQNLKEITIPGGVKKLPQDLFRQCRSLKRINLNKGLEVIENNALSGLDSLETIELPEGLKELSISLNDNIKDLHIPSSVIKISGFNSKAIKNIYFPDSVKTIENLNVNGPETIRFPRSLEKLSLYKAISYAHEDKRLTTTLHYNFYSGGYYLGNEDNPYLALAFIDEKVCQKEFFVHADCKIVTSLVFVNNIVEVVHLPKEIHFIGKSAFCDSKSLRIIVNPSNYDLDSNKCVINCPNLEKEKKGLLGKQIQIINKTKKKESEAEEKYQIFLEEDDYLDASFKTKLIYHRQEKYLDGRKVTYEVESVNESGISRASAISVFELLKENNLDVIDINKLDQKALSIVLTALNSVIKNVSLIDMSPYKMVTNSTLEEKYINELSKYSDAELESLLLKCDDVEYEKIRLVKKLRSQKNETNDGGENDGLF